MTEAMPFLQKAILLSYAPRSFWRVVFDSGSAAAVNKSGCAAEDQSL